MRVTELNYDRNQSFTTNEIRGFTLKYHLHANSKPTVIEVNSIG
jgi:hypothetical protein